VKRTDGVELDEDFEYTGEVIKSYVDETTGRRIIIGAATGLEEDHDGERMSKRAIANMVNAVNKGGVKVVAGTHEQNWLTEIGDGVHAEIDPETDQLMVKTELPPEGVDPIADKAWIETHKRKMGWSVGGKLRAAYHELTETGKKRKVLDLVDLRHLCLTDKPAYQHSFAHAVAKTWDGDEPSDEDFKDESVAKDVTGSWASGGGGNSGQDSETGGKRNAGTKKPGSKGPNVQDDKKTDNGEDDDDERSLEPAARHLSCPQCGHEFAADIPVDMTPEERAKQDDKRQDDAGSETSKALSEEATMDLVKRMKDLEDLVAEHGLVEKTGTPEGGTEEAPVGEVAKTDTPGEDVNKSVLRMVALATGDQEERIEKTRDELREGFQILGKAVKDIKDAIGSLPTGRKSQARILPPASGHDDVGKTGTVDDEIAKTDDPVAALKILNEHTYGIR
jgi:hypothetical protein